MKEDKTKIEFVDPIGNKLKLDYDEISPITSNTCVIVEADEQTGEEHRICMESGFVTRTSLVIDSEACLKFEEKCSELMKKVRANDNKLGTTWYPTFMQLPGVMLYISGTTPMDLMWNVARIVPIYGEERKQYPVPGSENQYYTTRLDVDNQIVFDGRKFEDALNKLYELAKERQHAN